MPEQSPMYMESLVDTRIEFENAIQNIIKRIALDTHNSENNIETYIVEAEEPFKEYFNNMKGATNIHMYSVEELLRAEAERQNSFYSSIRSDLSSLNAETVPPDTIIEYPHWGHMPSPGCNIRIGATVLYAFPRTPASTVHYLTLKQGPIPANLVHVTDDYILMLPFRQDLNKETRTGLIELSGFSGKVNDKRLKDELRIKKGYITLITEEKFEKKTLDELIKEYGVKSVMIGRQSSNTAYIHTGEEDNMPRLWSIIYFNWNENWRRHQ